MLSNPGGNDIIDYLRDLGISSIYQEAYENERALKTTFSKKQFGPRNLFQDDFPHWCLPNAESILNLKVVELPNDYEALYPWTNEEPQTDAEGWKYSLSFYNTPWHATCQSDSLIRRRVWHRVVVPITQAAAARTALNKFYSTCCSYRALNFQLIDRALCDFSHQFQIIYELQRHNIPNVNARNASTSGGAGGGGTSSYCHSPNVISSSDPIAAWSTLSNPIHDPSLDFSSSPPSSLDYVPINQVSFNCPPGWVVLHEFVHSVHPDSDEIGWVYSYSPSSSSPSQLQSQLQDQLQQSQNTHPVSSSVPYRRRKWFRTLVHVSNYSDCRLALTSYLTSHPRGLIKQGNLYKKSSFQHVWLSCSASLVDDELILSGSQENKSFPLHGLEVIPLKSHECIGYQAGFALRKKAYDHSVSDVLCSLTSDVISEVSVWMEALSHQIAFVNNDFNPLPFGPVISDPVLLTDDMWKRSDILQVWRLRTLQLHESGFLIYYHGGQIRDRIDLNGCRLYSNAQASSPTHASTLDSSSSKLLISSTSPTSSSSSSFDNSQPNGSDQERSFTIITREGQAIRLRTMTIPIKQKWLQAINRFVFTTKEAVSTSVLSRSDIAISEKDQEIEVKSSVSSSFRFASLPLSPHPHSSSQVHPEGIELQSELPLATVTDRAVNDRKTSGA